MWAYTSHGDGPNVEPSVVFMRNTIILTKIIKMSVLLYFHFLVFAYSE